MTTSRRFSITLDGRTHEVRLTPGPEKGQLELELEAEGPSVRERVRVLALEPDPLVLVGTRVLKWSLLEDRQERTLSRASVVKTARLGGTRELTADTARDERGPVRAPMPGRIVEVAVSPGQDVTPGTLLLVIEAMKMQNELLAPGPGRIEAVLVRAGDAVERGAELIRIA